MADLLNPGFDDGTGGGWTFTDHTGAPNNGWIITSLNPQTSPFNLGYSGTAGTGEDGGVDLVAVNDTRPAVSPGVSISARCYIRLSQSGLSGGQACLFWYDEDEVFISRSDGNRVQKPGNASEQWIVSSIVDTAPAGAAFVSAGFVLIGRGDGDTRCDSMFWNYEFDRTVTLISPLNGAEYTEGDNIPFRVTLGGTEPDVESVTYKADGITLATLADGVYNFNSDDLLAGEYDITAEATLVNDVVIISNTATITVSEEPPPPPTTREYKASNAYTFLVAENFQGLASAIPSVALVTGVEVVMDYTVDALVRAKDIGIEDPTQATINVAFDITDGGTVETIMMTRAADEYTRVGSSSTLQVPLERDDFTVTEEGTSEGKKWAILESSAFSTVLGSETELFGGEPITASDFKERALGFRFYPNLLTKPAYADTGDACFRFRIDRLRARIYFDAGSVEYYFASPDKTQVIKGRLVSAEVLDGDFRTGDAEGVLQLASDLEVMDGTQTWIGNDWTIHAGYPPTDANQIGLVADIVGEAEVGMEYNGLPTQQQIRDNRSRYVFITANFYGDKDLDSIYGAHGLGRAFAYNSEWFYKIYTQPDPEKDKPRHVAYHHAHLALGYEEGRVDISVAGTPYSFDGARGASSWGLGDRVVGLLSLSGTILGAFCSKSVWGISGTTVDNFATQVISPNMGAIEYTICDMGSPVYANAYGIYTLSQTQQYGDYLGSPFSQAISPWLRPRLVRKYTSDKEVVVAWPVRHKNQYRLAFADGYVLSMTLNGQDLPTFSKQKYFYQPNPIDPYVSDDLYSYPAIVPAAISSELDDAGQERIHIAPYVDFEESA